MKFRDCLKQARENAGLTQRELAEKLSVPASMIGRYESSDTEPRVDLLKRICKVLDITPNVLLNYSSSSIEDNISLIKSAGVDIKEGDFLEHSPKAFMTGKGKMLHGYILTHLDTGVKLEIENSKFEDFLESVIEKAKKANSDDFKRALKRSINIEFFSSFAFISEDEIFDSINQELEEIKVTGDLQKIEQTKNKLKYLQVFYNKLRSSQKFRKEIGCDDEYEPIY